MKEHIVLPFLTLSERVTGIILAGGSNSRFGGEKALVPIGGVPMLCRVIEALSRVTGEILVVGAKKPLLPPSSGLEKVRFVPDAVEDFGPVAGILSGLEESRTEYGFCVACDMPFLDVELIRAQIDIALTADIAHRYDVVVPVHESGLEPLHALYSRRCVPTLRGLLKLGEHRVAKLYPLVKTHYFRIGSQKQRNSFFNVNTKDDLLQAKEMC
jgi:molybdopterin-guanine dinucleotide biosynthesis protein A